MRNSSQHTVWDQYEGLNPQTKPLSSTSQPNLCKQTSNVQPPSPLYYSGPPPPPPFEYQSEYPPPFPYVPSCVHTDCNQPTICCQHYLKQQNEEEIALRQRMEERAKERQAILENIRLKQQHKEQLQKQVQRQLSQQRMNKQQAQRQQSFQQLNKQQSYQQLNQPANRQPPPMQPPTVRVIYQMPLEKEVVDLTKGVGKAFKRCLIDPFIPTPRYIYQPNNPNNNYMQGNYARQMRAQQYQPPNIAPPPYGRGSGRVQRGSVSGYYRGPIRGNGRGRGGMSGMGSRGGYSQGEDYNNNGGYDEGYGSYDEGG